jgi:hypothetical protein
LLNAWPAFWSAKGCWSGTARKLSGIGTSARGSDGSTARLLDIDIETFRECGGAVKVIACIEDPVVIEKILSHLNKKAASAATGRLPGMEKRSKSRPGLSSTA